MQHLHKKFPRIARVACMDTLVYVVSFLSLLFTFDQVRVIYVGQDASGVSLVTWSFYIVSAAVWFWYGYMRRDRVLMIVHSCWVLMSGLIVVGVILYGGEASVVNLR